MPPSRPLVTPPVILPLAIADPQPIPTSVLATFRWLFNARAAPFEPNTVHRSAQPSRPFNGDTVVFWWTNRLSIINQCWLTIGAP
jgi:hypothetical protein